MNSTTANLYRIPIIAVIDGHICQAECDIEPGKTTVAEVLQKTSILEELGIRNREHLGYGCYGVLKSPDDTLDAQDRLEIFERLNTDPTESRRRKGLEEKKARQSKSAKTPGRGKEKQSP